MGEAVLKATLYFGLNSQARQKLAADLGKLKTELSLLESEAVRLETAIKDAHDPAHAKKLRAELQHVQLSITKTSQAINDQLNKSLKESEQRINSLRESAKKIGEGGQTVAATGVGILAPFLVSIRSYVQYAGMADVASRQWLDSQKKLEQAQLRVGRAAAAVVAPALETVAGAVEKVSYWVEQNPELLKMVMGTGGIMAGAGSLMMLAARGIKLVADVKSIAAAALQSAAAQKMLAAAGIQASAANKMSLGGMGGIAGKAAVGAGAVAVGGTIGGFLADKIFGPLFYGADKWEKYMSGKGPWEKFIETSRQAVAVVQHAIATVWTGIIGLFSKDLASQYAAWQQSITIAIAGIENKSVSAVATVSNSIANAAVRSQAAVDTYINYRKAQEKADTDYQKNYARVMDSYEKQRAQVSAQQTSTLAKMTSDFSKAQEQARRSYEKQRGQALADFHEHDRRAEAEYYQKRTKAASDHSRDAIRAEQDHQKSLIRMQQDYNMRQRDAIAERDVDAYMRNLHQYNNEREQSEQEYADRARRQNEEYALELVEMEEAFQEQRDLRQADFAERMAEMAENYVLQSQERQNAYDEQLAETRAQYAEQFAALDQQKADELSELDKSHQEQLAALEQGLAEQLAALDQNLLGEQALKNAYYERMTADLERWLAGNAAQWRAGLYSASGWSDEDRPTVHRRYDVIGGRAAGGYMNSGVYRVGEQGREFVLNATTTRLAERLAGGALTQQNVLSGVTRSTLDINVNAGAYNADLVPTIRAVVGQFMSEFVISINGVA